MSKYRTRKIFYDNTTGSILDVADGDIVSVDGVYDTTFEEALKRPNLKNVPPSQVSMLELEYEDRREAILNAGSLKIEAGKLIIYPRLIISLDYPEITSTQTSTITVMTQEDCIVTFQVDDGELISKDTINKQVDFTFQSDVPDTYAIKATTELYGFGIVEVAVSA